MENLLIGNWLGHIGRGLARRELQCVVAIASGMSSKEISRVLGIAPSTVDKRILSASTKLGVIKRAALVAEAMRLGLIAFSTGMTPSPQRQHDQQESTNGVLIA